MSLVQLLAVGRSLGRANDPPSRYRLMTQQSLLPKFGSTTKPERSEPATTLLAPAVQDPPVPALVSVQRHSAPAPSLSPPSSADAPIDEGGDEGPDNAAFVAVGDKPKPALAPVSTSLSGSITVTKAKPMHETKNLCPVAVATTDSVSAALAQPLPGPAFPRGRWTVFKNPFSGMPKPKVAQAPMQGELSLDAVKPIRNDLTDSDLEVIPAGKAGPRVAPPPITPGPPVTAGADGLVWERLKTQFFGAEET